MNKEFEHSEEDEPVRVPDEPFYDRLMVGGVEPGIEYTYVHLSRTERRAMERLNRKGSNRKADRRPVGSFPPLNIPIEQDAELTQALRLSEEELFRPVPVSDELEEAMRLSAQIYEEEQFLFQLMELEEERKRAEMETRKNRFASLVPVFKRLAHVDATNRDIYEKLLEFIESYTKATVDVLELPTGMSERFKRIAETIRADRTLMEDLMNCIL
jgi:hypothetical protein